MYFRSSTRRRFPLQFDLIVINGGTDEICRAHSLILSPSKKSIARLALCQSTLVAILPQNHGVVPCCVNIQSWIYCARRIRYPIFQEVNPARGVPWSEG